MSLLLFNICFAQSTYFTCIPGTCCVLNDDCCMTSEPSHLLALILIPLLLSLIFNVTIKKNMILSAAKKERSVKEASRRANKYALLFAALSFIFVLFATNKCLIPKGFSKLNQVPVLVDAKITPKEVFTTTKLICSASVVDDNLPIEPSYRWNLRGKIYEGDTLQLNNVIASPNDTVECVVEAIDKYGVKATDSISVLVQNILPKVSAKIDVKGEGNTAKLNCLATASDAEDSQEPNISFEWFDQQHYFIGTENPLQLDRMIGGAGDQISCVATAKDLSGGTASDTVHHTITNTPPYIDFVQLSPSSPNEQTTAISCYASASDVDGDDVSLRYKWLVNNKLQNETTSVLQGPFSVGDRITCEVIPNDGTSDGKIKNMNANVQCTKVVSTNGFNMDSLSVLEDVENAETWIEDAIIISNTRTRSVTSWKVAFVEVLVMIPKVRYNNFPTDEKVTVKVYEFDDPRYVDPWIVSKKIHPSDYNWEDYSLPPGFFNTPYQEHKGAWVRFDFRDKISDTGMRSNDFIVGVVLDEGSSIGVGYSKYNHNCGKNWTLNSGSNIGWKLHGDGQGYRCSWPMLKVTYESNSISTCK